MKKYLLFSALALILSGCASGVSSLAPSNNTTNNQNNGDFAQWILKPKNSNDHYFYAVGDGKNKDAAMKDALAKISAQISVTISSNTLASKKVTNDVYEKKMQSTTTAFTDNIKFSGVTSLDTTFVNGTFYNYIQVDRNILFQSIKKDFDLKIKQIKNLLVRIENNDPFLVFKKGKFIEKSILESFASLSILDSINKNFDSKSDFNKLEKIKNDFFNKKASIKAYVETNSAYGEKAILEKAISEFGIKVVPTIKNIHDKNLLRIVIQKSANKVTNFSKSRKLQNIVYADVKLVISTYNSTKKTKLAQNVIEVRNGTRENYQASVAKTKKFEREIKEQGLLKILLKNIDS